MPVQGAENSSLGSKMFLSLQPQYHRAIRQRQLSCPQLEVYILKDVSAHLNGNE